MTAFHVFLKGLLIGFVIAAPLGPIAALCIRRTLQRGRWAGLLSGLGAATADACFCLIAAFGITAISDFLIKIDFWLRLIGGLFLLYLGIKTFFKKTSPEFELQPFRIKNYFSDFATTFFLTITNPLTIFGFAAIFAALGMASDVNNYILPLILVAGVFLGSGIWWIILSEGITFFRTRISYNILVWSNRIAAAVILAFGLFILINLF